GNLKIPQECIGYIGKYKRSSQYKADCERAIEECQVYLSSRCNSVKGGEGKGAWIFDVDDTLLSTVQYFKSHGFGGEEIEYYII
ncbi:acid phosphatase 1-like, partial [Olea europaea subsp. europaea]